MSLFDFGNIAHSYDAYYDTDLGRRIDAAEKACVERFLARLQGRGILEIGCGTGHWSAFFRERGFAVTGLDVSPEMLAVAAARRLPGVELRLGDAQYLDLPDGTAENVAAITSLEFVEDLERALAEIRRVLRPGGHLLVGCLNEDSWLGRNRQQDEVLRHARFFTPAALRASLARFGAPELDGCVLLEDGALLDEAGPLPTERRLAEGAFLVGCVRRVA